MKTTEIRYDYTFNKGNYESEKIGATVAPVLETDTAERLLAYAKAIVHGYVTGNNYVADPKQMELEPIVEEKEEPKKKTKSKKVAKAVEEKVEEKVEEVEEKPAAKVKGATPYNRADALHKKLIGELLDRECPNWKKEGKGLAASKAMEGKDFLDRDGQILPSFSKELSKVLAVKDE